MFRFWSSGKEYEPLNNESREYLKQGLLWLADNFPEPGIAERKVLMANDTCFDFAWKNNEETAYTVLQIVCKHMQIQADEIDLLFIEELLSEIDMGGSVMFLQQDKRSKSATGYYHGRDDKGRISIALDRSILKKPLELIATLSHELSHLKLLDEKALTDDEYLTDLSTVYFGLGIFSANASFQFYQNVSQWGYNRGGYLNQEQWAYALALFAFLRNEENPEWKNDLNATIRKDFERSLLYILKNADNIFPVD